MTPEQPPSTAPSDAARHAQADHQAQREARWRRVWASRAWPAWGWWPLSRVYGGLLALRRAGYALGWLKATRVPCPVLVVGNVMVGGAGKTPTTIALVQHLQARGLRVGVISRGHGRQSGDGKTSATADCLPVTASSAPEAVGDEPLLIHLRTGAPLVVARQRALAAQALLAAHPGTQLLICDDGLQHLALARDLQLCVFDERGIGNGWLLPAGPLREPWPQTSKRKVDWAMQITPSDWAPPAQAVPGAFAAQRRLADFAVDAQGRRVPLTDLRARHLVAFAGIAKPEAFFASLRAQGLQPARELQLGDHASALDHAELAALLRAPGQALLPCTEKDAVKLWPQFPQLLAVPLQLQLPADLLAQIDARVDALLTP